MGTKKEEENDMETRTGNGNDGKLYNERLTFYHANRQGSGAAVRIEPRINRRPGERYNCFFLDMARQKTVAARGDGGSPHATFDWENKVTVKLDFMDVCELLTVLEGTCDHVGGKRDGLYHQTSQTNTLIRFKTHESGGYALAVSRKTAGADQPTRVHTVLNRVEATGLRHILQVGLFFVTLPMYPGTDRTGENGG
jgi:hypothetical protein